MALPTHSGESTEKTFFEISHVLQETELIPYPKCGLTQVNQVVGFLKNNFTLRKGAIKTHSVVSPHFKS
jgi:hypothetical protein